MGVIQHHAIIVTSFCERDATEAHAKAVELHMTVSALTASPVNDYFSFAVFPDGSKEGWMASAEGNEQRNALVAWLNEQAYEDGSNALRFVEVSYGECGMYARTNCNKDQAGVGPDYNPWNPDC